MSAGTLTARTVRDAGTAPVPGTPAAGGSAARGSAAELLDPPRWRELEAAHAERADALTAAHRGRRLRGEQHPIEDFLFTYYPFKPAELRRWHPGAGVELADAAGRGDWRYYLADAAGTATVDLVAFFAKRAQTVDYVERLLAATLEHTPQFGCFGLHEWAMVYRLTPEEIRHTRLPLRIGHDATDAVVESHPIGCSHFDAYRFFTPAAAPLNRLAPTRENQPAFEQSGCLHAGMDIYKWVTKLGPVVPGELLLDAFEFARDIRFVDMRASPYDVRGYVDSGGIPLEAIAIETPAGKREYVAHQRGFAERGNALRVRVLAAIARARAALPAAA